MSNLVETLCDGFHLDPLFVYAFPGPEARRRVLPLLFRGALRHADRWGGIASSGDGHAVAAWVPSRRMNVTLLDAARCSMLALPLRAGLASWRRFSSYEGAADDVTLEGSGEPFAYLWMVAARSHRRGEGLGRAVVEAALEQMGAAGYATCRLRTQQPRNLGLYQHLGFDIVGHTTPPGSDLTTTIFERRLRDRPGAMTSCLG